MMHTTHPHHPRRRRSRGVVAVATAGLLLAGCGSGPSDDGTPARAGQSHDEADGNEASSASSVDDLEETGEAGEVVELAEPSPRLALAHDDGVLVLDALTLKVLGDLPTEGPVRLNPAGDGRHLLLSAEGEFRVLDSGTWSEAHGDHAHSFASAPRIADLRVPAQQPGHVVHHAGRTVLFDDGTGALTVFDPAVLAEGHLGTARQLSAAEAHHGVAVALSDDSVFVTLGDSESRVGAEVRDASGELQTRSEECPGVHGEAVAAPETVVVGCEGGVLLYRDGDFVTVPAPHADGRVASLVGSEDSTVVLGDYTRTDDDGTTVALVDTETAALTVVDLPTGYSFRSLGRDDAGDALVLGTDGVLHTLDQHSGEVVAQTRVTDAWTAPEDWQEPRPALFVLGALAYVTEPASRQLHVVDLRSDELIDSTVLPHVPRELSGVTG